MSNLIKKFNVTINGDSATYEVGADAKNVQFSDEATSPFTNETVEDNVPVGIVEKAENRIYGNAYIKNNDWDDIEGAPEDFGPIDDIQIDRRTEGARALTISYGFNSLAKGHHSTAIGFDCEAAGWASHAEGWKATTAQGTNYSHAEGAKTEANHNAAHAEGDAAKAYGYGSHAEGRGTYVYGVGSHAEGMASNIGYADKVAWQNSNALHGFNMTSDGSNNDVDVELTYPKQIINGQLSHAEGLDNTIYGACCHAEGMYNTIHKTYASTAMGEENNIYSSASVAMGYKNTLNAGSNNSLILGNNNVNPGYPNSLFLGQYCGIETGGGQAPALVIGSGDATTPSNLMTIRHPQTGVASPTNRGDLWGEHLNAHFGSISGAIDSFNEEVIENGSYVNPSGGSPYSLGMWFQATASSSEAHDVYSKKAKLFFNWIKSTGVLIVSFQPCHVEGYSFVNNANPAGKTLYFKGVVGMTGQGAHGPIYISDEMDSNLVNFIKNDLYYGVNTATCISPPSKKYDTADVSWCRLNIVNLINKKNTEDSILISCNREISATYHPVFTFVFYGKPYPKQ